MGKTQNINLNYGIFNMQIAFEGVIQEARKGLSFHNYHKEDNGEIGHKNYCKACGKIVENSELVKGYEVAGKMATFTEEELQSKFSQASAIRVRGFTNETIPEYQVKKCYLLGIGTDSKLAKINAVNYELLKALVKSKGSLVVDAKMNSRGIKGGDLALIKYNEQYNRLILVELFYTEEIKNAEKLKEVNLPQDTLMKVVDKNFGNLTEISLSNITETQSKKVFEEIESRLNLNPLEEKAQADKPKISEEEAMLLNMV